MLFTACITTGKNQKYDEYFYAILDSSMASQKNPSEYEVIDKLYDLKEKSKKSNQLLVDLLDYYIGAGGGEILMELITEKGTPILPLLIAKKAVPIDCIPRYKSICFHNINSRNEDIDLMIEAIKRGEIIRVEDAE
jgi:hypothetical protein